MVDVSNEILDAIEIIIDAKIRENTAQIYSGVCKGISGNTCVMSINGRNNTVQFYGSTPTVGSTYRVFVPNGNMSMAFIITGTNDGSGGSSGVTSYTKLTDLPTINSVVLQEGATSKSLSLYGIGNEPNYPVTKVNGKTGEVILTADDVDALPSSTTIVNPNLLDNWYFGNPVNQRGQTEYTGGGYTVDRWLQGFDGTMTSTLTDDGIKIVAGNDGTYKNFEQVLPDVPANSTFTLSFLVDNYTSVNQIYCELGFSQFDIKDNLISLTFKTGSSISGRKSFGIQVKVGKTTTILAAKLELGSTQTLAHLENGNWVLNEIHKYEDVLSNCQRYAFNVVNSDDNYEILGVGFAMNTSQFFCFIPTPVTLRGKPTVKYSGSFRAVRNISAANGIVINSMSVDHASNNGVSVICGDATSSFEVGEYYTLWCIPAEETNSLIFSADL